MYLSLLTHINGLDQMEPLTTAVCCSKQRGGSEEGGGEGVRKGEGRE